MSDKQIDASEALNGTDYLADESGWLCHRAFKKEGASWVEYQTRILNGVIVAKEEIVFDNGQDQERQLSYDFHQAGGKVYSGRVPMREVTSNNIVASLGLAGRPAIGAQIKARITDSVLVQEPRVKRLTIYQHTGDREIDGRHVFLYNGGAIGADNVSVELTGRNTQYVFPDSDSPDKFKTVKLFLNVARRAIMLPLLALAFLSPLNAALRRAGIEPAFLLMLLGVTGSFKSTLAALAMNFFGEAWNNKSLPFSLRDTANAIERGLFQAADVLAVVDDYHPAGSKPEASRMAALLQSIARAVGDRIGRQRMNADSTQRRSYIPRGNVLVTGEDFPADIGQSGTARCPVIEVKRGDVDIKTLSEIQANTVHLAEVMRDFIKWLLPQYGKLPETLKKRFLALRERAQGVGHGRTAEVIAHLQIAVETYTWFMYKSRQMTAAERDALQAESWQVFTELAEEQNRRIQQDRPTTLFLSALRELLDTGEYNVEPLKSGNPYAEEAPEDTLGFYDDDYFYLYPDTVYMVVKRFYNQADRNFPLSKGQLFKHLQVERLIDAGEDRATKVKNIRGKNKRMLWLKSSALAVQDEGGESNE